ncbi:MAG: diguanylate cyclase [Burkholderiales bacterium]|nr:diguanylate cyclase [Burkholderiales bacterium]
MTLKHSPARTFAILLALIFAVEILLMLVLDHWLPPAVPVWLKVLIDASLLTAIAAYFIRRLFLRPLTESLLGEAARARAITKAVAESIVTIDARGTIESFNPAAERMFGHAEAEVIGRNVKLLMPEPDHSAHDGYLEHHMRTGENRIIGRPREVVALHKNGTLFPIELNVAEIKLGSERRFTGVMRDITERKISEARIQRLAHYDHLTDLPNRALFYDRLQQAMTATRRQKNSLALCYIDLDGFKAVNDNFGHDKGDELLKEAALRLQHAVRESDTVARLGGDEFAVILPTVAGRDGATLVAGKIIESLVAPFHLQGDGQPLLVGASIGIAMFPEDTDDLEILVKLADDAMYRAKQVGNRFQFAAGRPDAVADPAQPLPTA